MVEFSPLFYWVQINSNIIFSLFSQVQNIFTDSIDGQCRDVDDKLNKELSWWADQRPYNTDDCVTTCVQGDAIREYNCCSSDLRCKPDKEELENCSSTINDKLQLVFEQCYDKICLPECSESYFEADHSTIAMTENIDNYKMWLFNSRDLEKNLTTQEAREYIQTNYVYLTIYLKNLDVRTTITSRKYNLNMFISNIGGVLGLFTGFSILTLTEIAELLLDLTAILFIKMLKICSGRATKM